MMANLLRPVWNKFIMGLGKASTKIGITPNMWTFSSFLMAILAAVFLSRSYFWQGLGLSIAMLLADAMDGTTARAGGTSSKFGMVLDHVVDRYAEFIIFGGLLLSEQVSQASIIFAISGMFMASYVRAKAESVEKGLSCTVGIAGRVEKLLLTYVAIILLALDVRYIAEYVFGFIGVLSHITVVQRMICARLYLSKPHKAQNNP